MNQTPVKIKTADTIYEQMLQANTREISDLSVKIMTSIRSEDVPNQILGLTSTLVCLLDHYGLSHINALEEANNMVYSADNNNMLSEFSKITQLMKSKWEI